MRARDAEGAGRGQVRRRAAHGRRRDDHGGAAREARRVRQAGARGGGGDLLKNGLELEAVSLTQLDQTAMEFFNPSNAFDAEGLTRLTEQIERRKKIRNDIEQDTMIADPQQEPGGREARRSTSTASASTRGWTRSARSRSHARGPARRAGPRARRAGAGGRAGADRGAPDDRARAHPLGAGGRGGADRQGARDRRQLEIERRQAVELAEQQRAIAVAEQSKAQSEAQAAADHGPGRWRFGRGEGLHRARDRDGRATQARSS